VADCRRHRLDGTDYLRHDMAIITAVSCGHPDVWEARHAAGDTALDTIQLESQCE
jgi:hypothetical protein